MGVPRIYINANSYYLLVSLLWSLFLGGYYQQKQKHHLRRKWEQPRATISARENVFIIQDVYLSNNNQQRHSEYATTSHEPVLVCTLSKGGPAADGKNFSGNWWWRSDSTSIDKDDEEREDVVYLDIAFHIWKDWSKMASIDIPLDPGIGCWTTTKHISNHGRSYRLHFRHWTAAGSTRIVSS